MRGPEEVRRAKEKLKLQVKNEAWYRGIGIAPGVHGLVIRLSVAPETDLAGMPHSFDGVPIEIVLSEGYVPR